MNKVVAETGWGCENQLPTHPQRDATLLQETSLIEHMLHQRYQQNGVERVNVPQWLELDILAYELPRGMTGPCQCQRITVDIDSYITTNRTTQVQCRAILTSNLKHVSTNERTHPANALPLYQRRQKS